MDNDTFPNTIVIFIISVLAVLNFYSLNALAQTSEPTPITTPAFCENHGGVNCSIINTDASIVCSDGFIDNSSVIFAVEECQKTLEKLANQDSDFMVQSGCFPPSELGCYSEKSYQSLFNILSNQGVANSELGREELNLCRRQIYDYGIKNSEYKQCLAVNNKSDFKSIGNIIIKPLLKVVFCPLFRGNNTSFDYSSDLCICDNGYFTYEEQCVDELYICQVKYGSDAYAQDGNCILPTPLAIISIEPEDKITPTPLDYTTSAPQQILVTTLQTSDTLVPYMPQTEVGNQPEKNIQPIPKQNKSLLKRILNSIISSLINILKLF